MKQLYIKTIVSSALLVFSSLANANSINFKNAANAIIDTETPAIIANYINSYREAYGSDSYPFDSIVGGPIIGYMAYNPPPSPYYIHDWTEIKRPVSLSELSNQHATFSGGPSIYGDQIKFEFNSYPYELRRDYLASYGQGGFTANFSNPVTSVSLDFKLMDYLTPYGDDLTGYGFGFNLSPYGGLESSTPIILSATYKDELGNVIGATSELTPFNLSLIDGTSQLNNSGFSIGSLKPFSFIEISWDSGSVTRKEPIGKYCAAEPYSDCYFDAVHNNLLTAQSFSYTLAAVPEPESYAMLLAGLLLIGSVAHRRKKTS